MTEQEDIYRRYIGRLIAADMDLAAAHLAQAIHRLDSDDELKDYRDDVAFRKAVQKYFAEATR